MQGVWGKCLEIDLGAGRIGEIEVPEQYYRDYMGGSGLAARLFMDRVLQQGLKADDDPGNPLIVATGPYTGTPLPAGATRFSVCGRSPMTGIWSEASCGGSFGRTLKSAGWDGLVIVGESAEPVVLVLDDGEARLESAAGLWGADAYETIGQLEERGRADGKPFRVLAIGPAGENGVLFANIINDGGAAAGRAGLGCLMGNKKLKAVIARGSRKVEFADPDRLKALSQSVRQKMEENITLQSLQAFGTNAAMDLGLMMGDVPIKNWSRGEWDEAEHSALNINGPAMSEKILTGNHSCLLSGCPVACKRVVKIDEGPYALKEGPGPEYETVGAFGTMLLNDSIEAVAKANEICNRAGMDTISCGCTIAWAMDCFEAGVIDEKTTGGLRLEWGAVDAILKLTRMVAAREGFGDLLSQGSARAARELGEATSPYLTTVKGLEAPMHDPRGFWGMAVAYATSNRGACHVNSSTLWIETGYVFYPEIGFGMDEPFEAMSAEGKALLNVKAQDVGGLMNSLCMCEMAGNAYTLTELCEGVNASTGWGLDIDSLMQSGERIWMIKRGLNNLMGVTRADDALPKKLITPLEEGPSAGMAPDAEALVSEFYSLRGIDEQGRPEKELLEKLGLGELAAAIY